MIRVYLYCDDVTGWTNEIIHPACVCVHSFLVFPHSKVQSNNSFFSSNTSFHVGRINIIATSGFSANKHLFGSVLAPYFNVKFVVVLVDMLAFPRAFICISSADEVGWKLQQTMTRNLWFQSQGWTLMLSGRYGWSGFCLLQSNLM